jgi:hypothetical protein
MTVTFTELRRWLTRDVEEPVDGWEPTPSFDVLRCDPGLVARVAEVSRPIGPIGRVFVDGCPVIHHPRGRAIAAAAGSAWLTVRSGQPAGALATSEVPLPGLGTEWTMLDPWAADVALSRTIDLLRAHVARAYELAERTA